MKQAEKYVPDLREKVLFLSHLLSTDIDITNKIKTWLRDMEIINYGELLTELIKNRSLDERLEDKNERDKIVKFLQKADKGILDLEIEEFTFVTEGGKERKGYQLYSFHEKMSLNGEKDRIRIPFQKESAGTQKIFGMYFDIASVIKKGSILIVDELDAKLHPNITKEIIKKFQSEENTKGAQLIYTSHDASLLDKDLFRRDEIWFVEKQNGGSYSVLFSLADCKDEYGKKIRNDASYGKDYLEGKYKYNE